MLTLEGHICLFRDLRRLHCGLTLCWGVPLTPYVDEPEVLEFNKITILRVP